MTDTTTRDAALQRLAEIGDAMDRGDYPRIGANGSVAPGPDRSPSKNLPGEKGNHVARQGEPAGSGGSEAGQGQGPARPGSPGTEGAQAQLLRQPGLTRSVRNDLEEAFAEHHLVGLRVASPVVWLLLEVHPLPPLPDQALLLVCYPLSQNDEPRSWAWWHTGVWIGPRHTNFPDGSICSHAKTDGVWSPGDPLLPLLDLYAVWVLRHLHLRHLGRWPGHQDVKVAYERVHELRPDELCGCGSEMRYSECHQSEDEARKPHELYFEFVRAFGVTSYARRPPAEAYRELRIVALGEGDGVSTV